LSTFIRKSCNFSSFSVRSVNFLSVSIKETGLLDRLREMSSLWKQEGENMQEEADTVCFLHDIELWLESLQVTDVHVCA